MANTGRGPAPQAFRKPARGTGRWRMRAISTAIRPLAAGLNKQPPHRHAAQPVRGSAHAAARGAAPSRASQVNAAARRHFGAGHNQPGPDVRRPSKSARPRQPTARADSSTISPPFGRPVHVGAAVGALDRQSVPYADSVAPAGAAIGKADLDSRSRSVGHFEPRAHRRSGNCWPRDWLGRRRNAGQYRGARMERLLEMRSEDASPIVDERPRPRPRRSNQAVKSGQAGRKAARLSVKPGTARFAGRRRAGIAAASSRISARMSAAPTAPCRLRNRAVSLSRRGARIGPAVPECR